jgi:hypothetical protein
MFGDVNMSEYFDSRTTANNTYITLMLKYHPESLILPSRLFSRIRAIHSKLNVVGVKDKTQANEDARLFINDIIIPVVRDCSRFDSESLFQVVQKIYRSEESKITLPDLYCLLAVRQCIVEAFVEGMVSGDNTFYVGKDHILSESYDNLNTRKIPIIRAFKLNQTVIHYSTNRYAVVNGESIIDCESDYTKAMSLLRSYLDSNKKKRKEPPRQFPRIKGLCTVIGKVKKKQSEPPIVNYMPSDSTVIHSDYYGNILRRIEENNKDKGPINQVDMRGVNYFVFGTNAEKVLEESRRHGNTMFTNTDYLKGTRIAHESRGAIGGTLEECRRVMREGKKK